jgi:succinyl-CoA synthetase beta subunit
LREIAAASGARPRGATPGRGADGWIDEIEAKELLRAGGVAVPEGRVVASEDECAAAADELSGPVALKLAGPRLHHKSDLDALRLNLRDRDQARAAYRELSASPAADGARILVERMEPPGVELLVAARGDAVVPALVIGLGGIWAETLDDVAVVPLPAGADRIEAAIRSLRGAASLAGGRGREPADLRDVASLAATVGSLLLERRLALLELNPVVVHGDGCVALDALGRWSA